MKRTIILTLITVCSLATVSAGANDRQVRNAHTKHVNLLWLLGGIRNTYECEIPTTDRGTIEATCHDHEIINLRTNKVIGWAVDATADVDAVENGFVGTGTTTFHLPQGTLVVRGRGTIQPVLEGQPVLNGGPVTHIAGIFPEAGTNSVLSGSGIFEGAEGTFSLLGALDLTHAADGQSQFHCVFFMNLELDSRHARKRGRSVFGHPRID